MRRVDGKKPPKLISLDITNSPLVGGIALETMSIIGSTIKKGEQVLIFINRRGFVIPDDVRAVVFDVLQHRIGISYEAEAENMSSVDIITKIVNQIEVP